MKIAIIGSGWYGCHLAVALKKQKHEVVLYEENRDIFTQVSGSFGVRLHHGPHYPRSKKTREGCQRGLKRFHEIYPELIVQHQVSIYGLGIRDSKGNMSKISPEIFESVCMESKSCRVVNLKESIYQNLSCAFNLDEPSIVVGERLRAFFRSNLKNLRVKLNLNCRITGLEKYNHQIIVHELNKTEFFDKVINATGCKSLLPSNFKDKFPFKMDIVYQPCLALVHQDKQPQNKAISFIVMDGFFPCLMPYVEDYSLLVENYILTHGSWTILGSFQTPQEAQAILNQLTNEFIQNKILSNTSQDMDRFYPEFSKRFAYRGWKSGIIAKLRNEGEFRSAVTFIDDLGVICIFPGKVQNIFDVEDEVKSILKGQYCLLKSGYGYVPRGVLDAARKEISEKPKDIEVNTCFLNTYEELMLDIH